MISELCPLNINQGVGAIRCAVAQIFCCNSAIGFREAVVTQSSAEDRNVCSVGTAVNDVIAGTTGKCVITLETFQFVIARVSNKGIIFFVSRSVDIFLSC